MTTPIDRTIGQLKSAVDLLDRKRVNELCVRLIAQLHQTDAPLAVSTARALLSDLRKKRFFVPMQHVADALLQTGHEEPAVRRQYAQSLIDRGALIAATAVLRELLADIPGDVEAQGLLGRVHKQRYVDAARYATDPARAVPPRDAEALREAIRWYYGPYRQSPADNYWHGINAVACTERARRDGVPNDLVADPHGVATDVLARIDAAGEKAGAWQLATAVEACVALGNRDGAIVRAVNYILHPDADAFEIASTLRQLQEVWELTSTGGLGKEILPLLRGRLLERENGGINVSPAEVRQATQHRPGDQNTKLEKFGPDAFTSYETYVKGAKRARTVARIGRESGGRGDGTGFLVRGCDLADRYKDEKWLLITNAHVISTSPDHEPAVQPADAIITFQALPLDGQNKVREYTVSQVLQVSGPTELDFAIIKLNGPVADIVDDDRCDVASNLPVNNQKGRVYIIGHPAGGHLSYSLQDNLLLDYEKQWLHYRAPTEGGSSGSPIYNSNWKLIGLHHAGSQTMPRLRNQGGTYAANEGIWIQSIRQLAG